MNAKRWIEVLRPGYQRPRQKPQGGYCCQMQRAAAKTWVPQERVSAAISYALAHRPAVLRRRAFAMGWRRVHRVGAVATPQFVCAFRLGRAWHTRTDRTTYESRGDRLLPPRA